MVRCGDCELCLKFKGKDGKKSYRCFLEYEGLLKQDNPEFWALFNNPEILERMIVVNRFGNRKCSNYREKKE